jgi:hypothetical protein
MCSFDGFSGSIFPVSDFPVADNHAALFIKFSLFAGVIPF